MYDAFIFYGNRAGHIDGHILTSHDGKSIAIPEKYYYLTCHRQENTDDDIKLLNILSAMNKLDVPTVYPVHPRNKGRALRVCGENSLKKIILCQPVGYPSIALVKHAEKIVTDSGGLQREAFFAEKKCVFVFDHVVWPETMVDGRNVLCTPEETELLRMLSGDQVIDPGYKPFGDGDASKKICRELLGI